ncbi:hypothetical protein ACP4OV_005823 [Aristida adscensionis]
MSRGRGLDLKLHLSPPPAEQGGRRAVSSDEESSPSSCVSSEGEQGHGLQWSDSPGATSMVLAACPRCLMYVMLSEADPRCPRCRSAVLLDFLHHGAAGSNSSGGFSGSGAGGEGNRNLGRSGGGGRRNRKA